MKTSLALISLTGASLAIPLERRQSLSDFNDCTLPSPTPPQNPTLTHHPNPVDVLNYALTLEHLEDKFYREGLANFTAAQFASAGYDSTFYSNLQRVSADETAHVKLLSSAITAAGGVPVQECSYAFGVSDAAGFVALASILEGVGASAYTGAAAQISSKAYLTVAASILSIEARHSSYVRASLKQVPFPQDLENPLTPNEVYTLAAPFIVSCPEKNPALPIRAFPALAVTTTGAIVTGQEVEVVTDGYVLAAKSESAKLYAAFVTAGGPVWTNFTMGESGREFVVEVPMGVFGQSYLVLSNCNDTVSDQTVVAGPALLEVW